MSSIVLLTANFSVATGEIHPTLNQQSHQKKLSLKKGTYIYICGFCYKTRSYLLPEIPAVVKQGDANGNTTIVGLCR